MNKLRLLALVLTCAFLFTALIGCGSNTQSAATTLSGEQANVSQAAEKASAEPVEIQFWDMVWGGNDYIQMATQICEKYGQEHSGVKIKYQSTPWNNWYQTFSTAIASGSAPDISTGAGYQAFQFYKIGAILPIDDVIADLKSSGKLEDFQGDSVELLKYDGHYIALPWQRDIRVMWYRKDLFDQAGLQPPTNWTEFKDSAKKLTKGDVFGFVMGGSVNNGLQFMLSLMDNNGGGLFDEQRNVAVNTDRNKETFEFISQMAKEGSINPASAGFTDDDAEKSFVSGKAAMYVGTPGIDDKYPELKGKAYVMAPLEGPHGDKGALNWINNIMLYEDSKYQKETKEFLKWWSENQKDLFTVGKMTALPVKDSFASDEYYTKNENLDAIVKNYVPIAKSTAANYSSLFPELNEIEGDSALKNAIQGLILKKDPDKMLNDLQAAIEAVMKKAQ